MSKQTERSRLVWLGVFTLILTSLRIWFSYGIGLAPDEAYYWQWSQDLSAVYFDHPPLIAWLVRTGTAIAGQNSIGVRLFCVLFAAVSIAVVYRLGRQTGLRRSGAATAAAMSSILPAPACASIIATPDTPLGICWLLALLALAELANPERSESHSAKIWYLLGASIGLGILAKHTAALLPIVVAITASKIPNLRRDLRTVHPWLASILCMAIALPYLAAEARTGFQSISFQLTHLSGALDAISKSGISGAPARIAELLSGQLGLLTPLVALWVVIALLKQPRNPTFFVLAIGFLTPVAAACLSALFTHPEQNWASLAHPAAAVIAMHGISGLKNQRKEKLWAIGVASSVLIVTALIHVHVMKPFLPLPADRDPTSRLHGWDDLESILKNAADYDAIVCDNYGLAAQVAWQLRHIDNKPAIQSMDRRFDPPHGSWLLLDQQDDWGRVVLKVNCQKTHSLEYRALTRDDGSPVRKIAVFKGANCTL